MDLYLHDIRDNSTSFRNPTMQLFAMEEDGTNVFVSVKNFKTYLYVGFKSDISEECVRMNYMEKFKQEYWYRNVSSMEIVRQKRLVGFSDESMFPFVKLEFDNIFKFYMTRKAMEKMTGQIEADDFSEVDTSKYPGMSVYESRSVDPTLKFFHSSGMKPSSYFQMEDYTEITGAYKKSHCTKEYSVDFSGLSPVTEERKPPPLLICSYDLETSGLNPKEDFIFQVSMIFARLGTEISAEGHASKTQTDGVVICVGKTESLEGRFPREIAPMTTEVNALIDNNRRVVERARMQVGNLAHSLKTPIAVLLNETRSMAPEQAQPVLALPALPPEHLLQGYLRSSQFLQQGHLYTQA